MIPALTRYPSPLVTRTCGPPPPHRHPSAESARVGLTRHARVASYRMTFRRAPTSLLYALAASRVAPLGALPTVMAGMKWPEYRQAGEHPQRHNDVVRWRMRRRRNLSSGVRCQPGAMGTHTLCRVSVHRRRDVYDPPGGGTAWCRVQVARSATYPSHSFRSACSVDANTGPRGCLRWRRPGTGRRRGCPSPPWHQRPAAAQEFRHRTSQDGFR